MILPMIQDARIIQHALQAQYRHLFHPCQDRPLFAMPLLVLDSKLLYAQRRLYHYGTVIEKRMFAGDVAELAKQKPVPMGKPAPQMQFFRAEYALNHLIASMEEREPSTFHVRILGHERRRECILVQYVLHDLYVHIRHQRHRP